MGNKFKYRIKEESTTGGGNGGATFNLGTQGENYATKYAFGKKKVKEGPGASVGPGPKAGPEGVKDNMYVKKFKYKLVNKPALNKAAKGIEVKALWEAEEIETYLQDIGTNDPAVKEFVLSRIESFDKLEKKLNELIPLLQQAKHKTMDFYRQNPDSFDIIFGTDIANDYLDDMIKLFKENNG
jgi:hypothetical protein